MSSLPDPFASLDGLPDQTLVVNGVTIGRGRRVRLRPHRHGDIMDLALAGRTGIVDSIDVTTDDEPHVSVTVDDDPGRDLGGRRYLGHRFFFRADELEPVEYDVGEASAPTTRVLVAGIGNIFFGDDAFGVVVARTLGGELLPAGVTVADFGIRGLDLAYALQEDCDAAVLVDAMPRGGVPGTVYVVEPVIQDDGAPSLPVDAHGMNPVYVLRLARSLGRVPPRVFVVGCEPATADVEQTLDSGTIELSPAVAAAVPRAIGAIKTLIQQIAQPVTRTEESLPCPSPDGSGLPSQPSSSSLQSFS